MENLECLIDPEGHYLPMIRDNVAKDFSNGDIDVMTLWPMYEIGLYCSECDKAYGLSKLTKPSKKE